MRTALLLLGALLAACGGGNVDPVQTEVKTKISSETSWHVQLQGELNLNHSAKLYDLDLFDTSKATIAQLKSQGKIVICYFSAGSFEDWREDKSAFNPADIGDALDGWEGENWLDIRSDNVRSIMKKRIQLAKDKGCTGVDPDNVDGYSNKTGFDLTAQDQISYNRFLADSAHELGLVIALKNDLAQISELEPHFDLAINEQCQFYDECNYYEPFKAAKKLVINIEYDESLIATDNAKTQLCLNAKNNGLMTKVMTLDLNGETLFSCF